VTAEDPVVVINDFDAAWNAHDAEGVLAFFTDDAVVKIEPPPPGQLGTYAGKEQIRDFVEDLLPGFHVEPRDHQVAGYQEEVGDRVIWAFTLSADSFRELGVDPVEGTAEAILQGYKLETFTTTFSPETVEKMQAAGS